MCDLVIAFNLQNDDTNAEVQRDYNRKAQELIVFQSETARNWLME